jgi:hypothetical protein
VNFYSAPLQNQRGLICSRAQWRLTGYLNIRLLHRLLGVLVLVMVLYIAGIGSYVCIGIGGGGALLLIWQTFAMNKKYGEHGLMKVAARKRYPKYILSRRRIGCYVRSNLKKEML